MSALEKLIEEVKAFRPDELQRVRELVDSLLDEQSRPPLNEDRVEKQLAAKVISLPLGAAAEAHGLRGTRTRTALISRHKG